MFTFNTEAVLYLAWRIANPTRQKLWGYMYLADKLSLQRYGRFILGDMYIASGCGPIPWYTYNLTAVSSFMSFPLFVRGDEIISERDAKLDFLSASDIECLDQAIQGDVVDVYDSAYTTAWERCCAGGSPFMSFESIIATLENVDGLEDYIAGRDG
jgi:hypothetical protein